MPRIAFKGTYVALCDVVNYSIVIYNMGHRAPNLLGFDPYSLERLYGDF